MRHAKIIGTGSFLPDHIMTNEDLAQMVDTSDEWIFTRTGIRERRISTGENTSHLAYKAAEKALEKAKMDAKEIELIICATITPDSFMPATACIVQDRLGAEKAAAFDIAAACTGFIYALVIADQFIRSGMYRNALVIGAETLSKMVDWEDRSTCVLFGDGAACAVLTATEEECGIQLSNLVSDGSKQGLLISMAAPLSNPLCKPTREAKRGIEMNGQEVFKFAVRTIADNIHILLGKSGLTAEDIKYIIPHQANKRIIEQAAKYCNIPLDKFYMNMQYYANTSAASIGIALDEMARNKLLEPGDKLILVGFGGGMTSGAILVEWEV